MFPLSSWRHHEFLHNVELQVVVFSWTKCPFCVNAKQLLDDVDAEYTAMELDIRDDGKAFRAELGQVRGDAA